MEPTRTSDERAGFAGRLFYGVLVDKTMQVASFDIRVFDDSRHGVTWSWCCKLCSVVHASHVDGFDGWAASMAVHARRHARDADSIAIEVTV